MGRQLYTINLEPKARPWEAGPGESWGGDLGVIEGRLTRSLAGDWGR